MQEDSKMLLTYVAGYILFVKMKEFWVVFENHLSRRVNLPGNLVCQWWFWIYNIFMKY